MKTAILFGATGLVGENLLDLLIRNDKAYMVLLD